MINRIPSFINHNRSAAKILKVCSSDADADFGAYANADVDAEAEAEADTEQMNI